MKKSILLCGLLLAMSASLASAAAGVNLRWNACYGGGAGGGVIAKTFACNSNTNPANETLVGSFELPSDLAGVSGVEIVVDIAVAGTSLPPWWQFKNAGACRQASLTANGIGGGALCPDWAAGGGQGGLAAYQLGANTTPITLGGANTARIILGIAVAPDALQDLFAGQEYFAFNAAINNAKTVGTGSCAGCNLGACIVCNSIKVATPPPPPGQPDPSITVSGPTNGTDSNFALWQGGAASSARGIGCPLATATHSSTWSKVKTLYR